MTFGWFRRVTLLRSIFTWFNSSSSIMAIYYNFEMLLATMGQELNNTPTQLHWPPIQLVILIVYMNYWDRICHSQHEFQYASLIMHWFIACLSLRSSPQIRDDFLIILRFASMLSNVSRAKAYILAHWAILFTVSIYGLIFVHLMMLDFISMKLLLRGRDIDDLALDN